MKTIEIIAPFVKIEGGTLKLSKEQAAAREHQLKPVPDSEGVYTLTGETHFIKGEVIGFDGEIPPALAQDVKPKRAGGNKKDEDDKP